MQYDSEIILLYSNQQQELADIILSLLTNREISVNGYPVDNEISDENKIQDHVVTADKCVLICTETLIENQLLHHALEITAQFNKPLIKIIPSDEADVCSGIFTAPYNIEISKQYIGEHVNQQLFEAIEHDKEYHARHKQFLLDALAWQNSGKVADKLLHGFGLDVANEWLKIHGERKTFAPTPLHREFIEKSSQSTSSVFISYGRRQSKDFVLKLYAKLIESNFDVWIDKDAIPLGVDFQEQINKGIEKSDNFIFVISPHAVKSQYCLREIELAVKYSKRIIPLMHVEPNDCMDKMHPTISKLNWIYFIEDQYNFQAAYDGLVKVLLSHIDYVQMHTRLLMQSLEWLRNLKAPEFLLLGDERKHAEEWLHTQFDDEQPPCQPTNLHCQYIVEAKKNANNLMTDIFISYDKADSEMMERLQRALVRRALSTWTDIDDVKAGTKYEDAIKEGIEQADNFLFLLSPASLRNENCKAQISYAIQNNKRILTAKVDDINEKESLNALPSVLLFDFTVFGENRFLQEFNRLLAEVKKEKAYFQRHKHYLVKALKWRRQKNNPSILLRGYELQNADAWLKIAGSHSSYPCLDVQEEFIAESRLKSADISCEVFISYSRANSDFARKLNEHLQTHGKTTWFDQENIASATDFGKEINTGIETSENFLFLISPYSVHSPYCEAEIAFAQKHNKRMITLHCEDTDEKEIPEVLRKIQWIDFRRSVSDFQTAFSELLRTLDTDREYVQNHNKWLIRATEWHRNNKSSDLLLRGSEFEIANQWFEAATTEKKTPRVTGSQKDYILASDKAIKAQQRRKKRNIFILRAMLVVMTILFIISIIVGYYNIKQTEQIKSNLETIRKQKEEVDFQRQNAERQRDTAKEQKRIAEIAKEAALEKEKEARRQRDYAKQKEREALENEQEAKRQRDRAQANEREAKRQKKIADEKTIEALNQKAKVNRLLMLSEAKILAGKALRLFNEGDKENHAKYLALHAFYINQQYNGPEQNQQIYDALKNVLQKIEKNKTYKIKAHNGAIRTIKNIPNSNMFVTGGNDGYIQIRQRDDLKNEKKIKLRMDSRIRSVDYQVADKKVFTGLFNGDIVEIPLRTEGNKTVFGSEKQIFSYNGVINRIVTKKTPDNQNILIFGTGDSIMVLQKKDGDYQITAGKHLTIGKYTDFDVHLGNQPNYMIAACSDGALFFWRVKQLQNGSISLTSEEVLFFRYKITAVATQPSGNYFAVGLDNGDIYVVHAENHNLQYELFGHQSGITCLKFHPDKNQLASCSFDNTTRLWLFTKGKNEDAILVDKQTNWIWSIAFARGGEQLITVGEDGFIRFHAISTKTMADRLCNYVEKGAFPKKLLEKYIDGEVIYKKKNCVSF